MALPTVMWTVVGLVTSPAKTHIERLDLFGDNHLLDFAMAKGTNLGHVLNLHPLIIENESTEMFFMSEMHEIGYVVNLFPGWRLMLFPVFGKLFDARFVCRDHAVATHAFPGRRNTRNLAPTSIGMAVHAVDLIDVSMDVVWKFNGLLDVFPRIGPLRRHGVRYQSVFLAGGKGLRASAH